MSRGLGRVQRACLCVIDAWEEKGKLPTTFDIAVEVYQIKPDAGGTHWVTAAQHVAVKRALEGLQRHRLVLGDNLGGRRSYWMTSAGLHRLLSEELLRLVKGLPGDARAVERLRARAKMLGWKI
jgi:hypothetical protein